MVEMSPLNGQKVTLAKDVSIGGTTFNTNGKLQKTSDGSGIIGAQFIAFTGQGADELIYVNLTAEPILIEDRSASGKLNIYQYTGIKFGIDSDDKTIPPTLAEDAFVSAHKIGDEVKIVLAAEYFEQMMTAFTENVANRFMQAFCFEALADVGVGDGRVYLQIPAKFDGNSVNIANASVITAGTTGDTTIQIYNVTNAEDVLSTPITIATTETFGSGVIDETKATVSTGDIIRIDIDSVSTTAPKGLIVNIEFTN